MVNTGDISFLFFASVIIILMTPAVAYFYGGLVEKKFAPTMVMQTFFAIPLITLVWSFLGFSLAYGESVGGFIGGLDFAFLHGILEHSNNIWAPTVPFPLYFVVQLSFAIITPVLIIGALVGRMRFASYVLFFISWSLLVYSPLIHWVWGGGILMRLGFIDFAGGLPVHGIAGFSALAAVLAIGNRAKGKDGPSDMKYTAVGVGILWAGWLIFNASGALAANETAALVALNTLISSSSGAVGWLLLSYRKQKILTVSDVIFGAFAGLVISTPTAGYVSPWVLLFGGFLGGVCCYGAMVFRQKKGWDDTLDVWALHGVGGTVGVLILGLFANPALAPATGLFYGDPRQFFIEIIGLILGLGYAVIATFVLVKIIHRIVPFRIEDDKPQDFGAFE